MAIEKFVLPGTGIYQQKITSVSIQHPSDLEGLRDAMQREENQPLPSLSELEAKARQVVLEYVSEERGELIDESSWIAVDCFVRDMLKRAREDIYKKAQSPLSEEQSRNLTRRLVKIERANDACNILLCLGVVRGQSERGSVEVAIAHAIWLGMAYERLKVRDHEPYALTGHKSVEGAKKGGHARKGIADAEYKRIVSDFRKSGLSERRYCQVNKLVSRSKLRRALNKVDS
jgi:hypothetical protein